MFLLDVMQGLPVPRMPEQNPEVHGVGHDSRRVEPGELFVAIRGESFDGRAFAHQAAERGAVAALGEGTAPEGLPIPWVEIEGSTRPWLGLLASRVYRNPHEKLRLVGITGTNGKSTITALTAKIFDAAELPAGSLGTLGYHFGGESFGDAEEASARTTPEAPDLFRILEAMRSRGARAVAMEVSSHALAMGRIEEVRFDATVFTNLTHDHLDFHGDMESYFEAKAKLFEPAHRKSGGRAVIHIGDPYGQRLAERFEGCLTFGPDADVRVVEAELSLDGTRARIHTPRGVLAIESRSSAGSTSRTCWRRWPRRKPWSCPTTPSPGESPPNGLCLDAWSRWMPDSRFPCSSTSPTPLRACRLRSTPCASSTTTRSSWSSAVVAIETATNEPPWARSPGAAPIFPSLLLTIRVPRIRKPSSRPSNPVSRPAATRPTA